MKYDSVGGVRSSDVRDTVQAARRIANERESGRGPGGERLMVVESGVGEVAFLLARLLFGGVLAFTGLNHFGSVDETAGYAEHKGLPAPRFSVVASGVLLLAGGAGIVAGVVPVVAAGALATFLLVSAVTMQDFWAVPDEQAQNGMTQFLKNVALAGGALALLAVGGGEWPYALGVGLF
jgi:putative oxidoreductase